MASIMQYGVTCLFLLLLGVVQPDFITKFSIVIDEHANVPTMRQPGFLFDAMSDGCMPLPPPPSSGNWFIILDDYNTCTTDKIHHAREAGYLVIITYGEDRTITDDVRNEGYPIIVTLPAYGAELKQYAVTGHGDYYVTISTENFHGEQDLRLDVNLDIPANNNGDNNNGGLTCFNASLIILYICLTIIFVVA